LTSKFFEESGLVDVPYWFRIHGDKKAIARSLKGEYERLTSDVLLAVCILYRQGPSKPAFPVYGCELPLLSDEAVESGREDYVQMVVRLGRTVTR
jgi:hypothetical protein